MSDVITFTDENGDVFEILSEYDIYINSCYMGYIDNRGQFTLNRKRLMTDKQKSLVERLIKMQTFL